MDRSVVYSVPVGLKPENSTQELRNPNNPNTYVHLLTPGLESLDQYLLRSFQQHPDNNCLGTKIDSSYSWKTYQEVLNSSLNLGSSLITKDLCPKEHQDGYNVRFLALYAKNCAQWHMADIACMLFGIATVPLYDTLGEDSIEFILKETCSQCIFLSNDKIQKIMNLKLQNRMGKVRNVIAIDEVSQELKYNCAELGLSLSSFSELVEFGGKNRIETVRSQPGDIFTLCYTSGTTGNPKGVIMTHGNIIAQISGVDEIVKVYPTDIHLSYLPLAHLYERLVGVAILVYGGSIGYYGGDLLKLREDLALLKPTILVSVPRVLNRFYDLIKSNLDSISGLKSKLIKKGIQIKLSASKTQPIYTHSVFDRLVFNKVKQLLGGRIRLIATASAPISPEVLQFLRVIFCCPIVEAYGQSECGGAATSTSTQDHKVGHVGGPLSNCSIKLVDIPEMNYFTSPSIKTQDFAPSGEVCLKGPIVMPKYFKNPELTKDVIDEDGWLHSGDVGKLLKSGAIQIFDRKKNIFKLSQGEYVAPEKLENVYIKSQYVALVFVYGDSFQDFTVGIIVPERKPVEDLAHRLGVFGEWDEICRDEGVKKGILEDIRRIGTEARLNGIEQVKKIYLHPEMLTPDSGLLTPTFKIKRYDMKVYFTDVIRRLYSS